MSWDAGPRKEKYPEAESQRKHEDILRAMEETKSGLITSLEHLKLTLKPIGVGFWGEVYKVVGESNEPQMVLKLNKATNCESRHNMLKEVNIMRSLDHPNIVRFHGVCVHNNQLHPLLEFVNGGTLEELLQNQNVELPWDTRLSIARDIACGMEYLHMNKIMHRDLTSNNILLKIEDDTSKVTALLADFGLATDIAPNAHAQTVRSVVGTVDWMAPEVILGEPYNFKADVFSYGIILCELIGRCEADPDVLPRTRKFEVDFDEFAQLACEGCPPEFLKLAKECCSLLPSLRPEFPQILQTQEELIRSIQIGQISNRNSMITDNVHMDGALLENLDISVDSTATVVDSNLTIDEDTAELILRNLALELSKELSDDSLPEPASPTTSHNSQRFSSQFSDQDLLNLTMKEPRYEGKPKNSGGAINIFQDNQRYKHLDQQNISRRSSIITLTPSVNRDSGRICLTFINDNSSSFDMGSPVPDLDNNNGLLSARDILEMQRKDEDKAIGDIQAGQLVLFKPELTFSTRHTSVDEVENNTLTKNATIPYAKRNFTQKKKIKPSFPKMFCKSDKKKSVSTDGATTPKSKESQGILGFFRSFSTKATGSSEKDSQSKSKIQKRKQSDDKQAGVVTKLSPHMSPKHVKQKIRIQNVDSDPKTPINNTASDPFNNFFNKTPELTNKSVKTKSNSDLCHENPQHESTTLTRTKRTLTSHSPDNEDELGNSPRNQVVRNESYRQMKAYRAQSIPSSDTDQETKKPGRSKSFREKFFLSDKAKNTRI